MSTTIKAFIPTAPELVRETIIVLVGVLVASYIISRFPELKSFVTGNSLTVKDQAGNVIV